MNPADLSKVALAASTGITLPKLDPLAYRRMASLAQRQAIENISRGTEVYWHAGNGSGKTEGLAHLFVAMVQGRKRIDGRLMTRPGTAREPKDDEPYWIDLPGLINGEPWRHWVLVNGFDQAKDSSMRAYRKLLGDWPHEIGWVDPKKGTVKLLKVRPQGWKNDDPASWSEITFISQEGMTEEDVKRVQGARINSAHGDEMPKENVWREVRARRDANQKIYLGIGATPEFESEWRWCLEDFQGCFGAPTAGRVRFQSSMRDNRALSLQDIADRIASYKGDSLAEARIDGKHCNISGACPFPVEPLERMLAGCQEGRIELIEIREKPPFDYLPDYRDILPSSAFIERWLAPDPYHSYLITNDTSRGIDDGKHDPCEMEVWDWSEPMLVLRFGMRNREGGFLDEDSLAILADRIGRQYGNAMIDVEVAGQWGQQFILTLRKLRYPNIAHNDRTVRPGVVEQEYGWKATPSANGEIVNALIKGLSEDSFCCWSKDVVQQWMDVREAADGNTPTTVKGARHHRESMICAGRALHWIQTRPAPRVVRPTVPTGFDAALRHSFGRDIRKRAVPGGRTGIFTMDKK